MTLAVSIAQSGANNVTMRNRVINGAMMIDQRNAGASVSMSSGSPYILDRWRFWANGSGGSAAYTVQQSSVAPAGFVNSIAITQTASFSPTGTQYNIFAQYIEGYNVADLGWGTASAQAVTLSFWVRSSLTGTFGGVVSNSAQARSYPFTYTISSTNTWEQKTITIPGDTAGTWLTTTATGMQLYWQLGVGSSYLGTAGAWAGATYLGATGATQITATNGATFYITGVQLEKGSTATSFDYRPYGTELQLCQRYCLVQSAESKNYAIFATMMGIAQSGGAIAGGPVQFPQQMRSAPTLTPSGSFRMSAYNTTFSASTNLPTIESTRTTTTGSEWQMSGMSGMTAGNSYYLQDQGSGTAKLVYSAEL